MDDSQPYALHPAKAQQKQIRGCHCCFPSYRGTAFRHLRESGLATRQRRCDVHEAIARVSAGIKWKYLLYQFGITASRIGGALIKETVDQSIKKGISHHRLRWAAHKRPGPWQ